MWRRPGFLQCTLQQARGVPGGRWLCPPLLCTAHVPLQAARQQTDESQRFERLPEKLQQKLMPFQREGILFALSRGGRALIGDEVSCPQPQPDAWFAFWEPCLTMRSPGGGAAARLRCAAQAGSSVVAVIHPA